jgi:hypothetical protein
MLEVAQALGLHTNAHFQCMHMFGILRVRALWGLLGTAVLWEN